MESRHVYPVLLIFKKSFNRLQWQRVPHQATTGSWKGSYCQIVQSEGVISLLHIGVGHGTFCFSYHVMSLMIKHLIYHMPL